MYSTKIQYTIKVCPFQKYDTHTFMYTQPTSPFSIRYTLLANDKIYVRVHMHAQVLCVHARGHSNGLRKTHLIMK